MIPKDKKASRKPLCDARGIEVYYRQGYQPTQKAPDSPPPAVLPAHKVQKQKVFVEIKIKENDND